MDEYECPTCGYDNMKGRMEVLCQAAIDLESISDEEARKMVLGGMQQVLKSMAMQVNPKATVTRLRPV